VSTNPVDEAVDAVRRGELIVFPTDTVYALACRPDDPDATARVFDAKRRPEALTLPVLSPSVGAARALADWDDRTERLAVACWPGALTIVVTRSAVSAPWELGGEQGTIGLRVPKHPLALAVLERTGPLAATSANRSGSPPARTCEELHETFDDLVGIYLCDEAPLDGVASTVIDLSQARPRLVRSGTVEVERLRDLLGPGTSLLDSPFPKVTRTR